MSSIQKNKISNEGESKQSNKTNNIHRPCRERKDEEVPFIFSFQVFQWKF